MRKANFLRILRLTLWGAAPYKPLILMERPVT